jgi:lysine 6-dehydrogenase
MSKIIVLGAGMVGRAMASDLALLHDVLLTDINEDALNRAKKKCTDLTVKVLDVTDTLLLKKEVKRHDLVVCAVPGFLGYNTLNAIIEAGVDVVDISFFPENGLVLDALARKMNVTAIVDCGVAPGMDNIILGYHNESMTLTDFECLVGGLPKEKKWPFNYKAPFSPVDVIEEYTRPARFVENGKIVVREALTDREYVTFDRIGTLESFNSDGLRSILYTMSHIPNMKEKTLRYPGHVEYIQVLKESGFFGKEKLTVGDVSIVPLDFTCKILFDEWKLGETEEELTVMRVTLRGKNQDGKREEIIYELYDEYDRETQTASMSRTTGYTATAVANMVLDGLFAEKGVFPPELVGKHQSCFDHIMSYLRARNVNYKRSSRLLDKEE